VGVLKETWGRGKGRIPAELQLISRVAKGILSAENSLEVQIGNLSDNRLVRGFI